MRSTRASAAVERLKSRSGNKPYSMVLTSDRMFSLSARKRRRTSAGRARGAVANGRLRQVSSMAWGRRRPDASLKTIWRLRRNSARETNRLI